MASLVPDNLGAEIHITLRDLCEASGMPAEFIEALVRHGVLEPHAARPQLKYAGHWRFEATALKRARTAARLRRDLGINLAGISLALELLEELEATRRERDALRQLQGKF